MQESKVKTLTAAVVSKSGDKSVTVAIDYKVKHPKYGKYQRRKTLCSVHDEENVSRAGDTVGIKTNVWTPIGTTAAVEQALKKRVMEAGVARVSPSLPHVDSDHDGPSSFLPSTAPPRPCVGLSDLISTRSPPES